MSSSPCRFDPIVIPLIHRDTKTILDAGCGYGRWGCLIQCNSFEAGLTTKYPQIDGFDAFLPNVKLCSQCNYYRKVWHQVMPSPLQDTWDTVLAIEIIEHIEQDKVEKVMNILEKAAKKRIIISTPNWPDFRNGLDQIGGYNEFEAHKSHLPRTYFLKRGYKIIGVGFGNPINSLVNIIRKIKFPSKTICELMPTIFPSLATHLIAYKDIE